MLKMSRNLLKVAIKKLTDGPRKNTCVILNVHSKNKLLFVQKVHNKVIRKQCKFTPTTAKNVLLTDTYCMII